MPSNEPAKSPKRTKKAFRELLNEAYRGTDKFREQKFVQRTREYGDYLYNQDRDQFNVDYEAWLAGDLVI